MKMPLYGVLAQFRTPEALLSAIHSLRAQGVPGLEAYSPYPVEGLSEALDIRRNCVPLITLLGGIVGGIGGFFMQWYASVVSFPINIGGRPLNSWPLFVPVSFELTILCAAFCAVIAMLAANGLPRLNHPLFDAPGFDLASQDRFFLCVRALDSDFDSPAAQEILKRLDPVSVDEVAA